MLAVCKMIRYSRYKVTLTVETRVLPLHGIRLSLLLFLATARDTLVRPANKLNTYSIAGRWRKNIVAV
jgi:hypothetical protein